MAQWCWGMPLHTRNQHSNVAVAEGDFSTVPSGWVYSSRTSMTRCLLSPNAPILTVGASQFSLLPSLAGKE